MSTKQPRQELIAFASWLRRQRRARRISQNALAEKLGVSKSAVSEYEAGARRPRLESLRKMVDPLETPLEQIEALLPSEDAETSRLPGSYVGWTPVATASSTSAAITRPALLFLGPNGEIEGIDDLDEAEQTSVRRSIATFRERRAARGGGSASGGGAGARATG